MRGGSRKRDHLVFVFSGEIQKYFRDSRISLISLEEKPIIPQDAYSVFRAHRRPPSSAILLDAIYDIRGANCGQNEMGLTSRSDKRRSE
jgi:hypothetical protein